MKTTTLKDSRVIFLTTGYEWHVVEALRLAVHTREQQERELGYTSDSAILATWRDMLEELDTE